MQKTKIRNSQPGTWNLQPDSGFTLLEIMVALSIIAIVLVSVYKMQAQSISMIYASKFYATAPLLAQLKIAEVEQGLKKNIMEKNFYPVQDVRVEYLILSG
ncbi:MAG: prepilin-type N-terminal cleavage/methylation domain-containing protein [Desulfobacterales bacterium]